MSGATLLTPTGTRKVYATTAPTLRMTYTNASGTLTSPTRVDFALTNPVTGVRASPVTVTASSTGVYEKQPTLSAAGKWLIEWIVYDGSDAVIMTDKFLLQVH